MSIQKFPKNYKKTVQIFTKFSKNVNNIIDMVVQTNGFNSLKESLKTAKSLFSHPVKPQNRFNFFQSRCTSNPKDKKEGRKEILPGDFFIVIHLRMNYTLSRLIIHRKS